MKGESEAKVKVSSDLAGFPSVSGVLEENLGGDPLGGEDRQKGRLMNFKVSIRG
jgi:hypothetical protein